MQKKKAIDMIDTAVGGMKTRFTNKGKNPTLLVLASSKRSEKSFLEEHIKKKAETDNLGTLIVDEPVWNVRPASEYSGKRFWVALGNRFLNSEVLPEDITPVELEIWQGKGYKLISVPVEYLANFKEDIDRALCDFAGISSSELTTYISGVRLMDCVNKEIENPFTKEIIDVGYSPSDTAQYYDFFDISKVPKELMTRPLYIHMDMSISGDKTGIAGVWIVGKKPPEEGQPASKELFFRLAFSVSVRAPKGQQISFEKNRQFIYWLKEKGFNIKGITTDIFQSCDTGQSLKAKNYNYDVLSVDRVSPDHICHPYQYFKSTIYDKRIEMFQDHLLIEEITGLERNSSTGKVDHSPNSINCLSGDTLVSLVDGRELSIENLVSEFNTGKENFVYTVNEQSGKIEIKKILNAFCSGNAVKLTKITLDNGETILCTPEHRVMLRDGTYREAKDLLVNDLPFPKDKYNILHYKVIKVETITLDNSVPVYDLTIEDNPNFALSCGVFVHNSKDKSDAVCGAVYNASLHADEYAFDFGEDLDPIKDVSNIVTNDSKKRTQLNIDFEQELNKMLDPLARNGIATKENTIQQIDAPVFYYGDGIIVW